MKYTLTLSLVSSLLLFSSCDRKTYSCHCDGGFAIEGNTMDIKATSKTKAQKKCEDLNNPVGTAGNYNCKLL